MIVQNTGKRGICRNWLILKAERKPENVIAVEF
jgi:hypothetical protein